MKRWCVMGAALLAAACGGSPEKAGDPCDPADGAQSCPGRLVCETEPLGESRCADPARGCPDRPAMCERHCGDQPEERFGTCVSTEDGALCECTSCSFCDGPGTTCTGDGRCDPP